MEWSDTRLGGKEASRFSGVNSDLKLFMKFTFQGETGLLGNAFHSTTRQPRSLDCSTNQRPKHASPPHPPLGTKFSSGLATCLDDGLFPHWSRAFLEQANWKLSLANVHETSQQPLSQTACRCTQKVVSTPAQGVA